MVLSSMPGATNEGHRAGHAGGAGIVGRHPESAVGHARKRVEVEIEMGERAALAGDVDDVVAAAEQAEGLRAGHFEHVGQAHRLQHVAAADHRIGAVAADRQAAEDAPFRPGRGLPGGDLAGFGAAVDLDQGCTKGRLGSGRELRRQRRSRADDEGQRRQLEARIEQCTQVEGRRHQHPRRRRGGEAGGDVGGEERPGPHRRRRRHAGRGARSIRSRTCAVAAQWPRGSRRRDRPGRSIRRAAPRRRARSAPEGPRAWRAASARRSSPR